MGSTLNLDTRNIDLQDAECVTLDDSSHVTVFYPLNQKKFVLIGNVYHEQSTSPVTAGPGERKCYSGQEISSMAGPYDYMLPIYHQMAIMSVGIMIFGTVAIFIHIFTGKGSK